MRGCPPASPAACLGLFGPFQKHGRALRSPSHGCPGATGHYGEPRRGTKLGPRGREVRAAAGPRMPVVRLGRGLESVSPSFAGSPGAPMLATGLRGRGGGGVGWSREPPLSPGCLAGTSAPLVPPEADWRPLPQPRICPSVCPSPKGGKANTHMCLKSGSFLRVPPQPESRAVPCLLSADLM